MDRLYIFDFDGTLSYTGDDIAESVRIIQKKYGAPVMDTQSILAFVGYGAKYLIANTVVEKLSEKNGGKGAAGFEALSDAIYRDYLETYCEHSTDTSILYPGVKETLEKLAKRGDRTALFTNKPRRATDKMLGFFGIDRLFEVTVCPEDVTRRKPDPEGILHCSVSTGIPLPKTIMIGDSAADVDAGRAAGVTTLALLNGMGDRTALLSAGPDLTAETFEDIPEISF